MFNNSLWQLWADREIIKSELGKVDNISAFNLLTFYYNLYLTRFKYKGIPDSIKKSMYDLSNLDRWLWYMPAVCFFKDPTLGLQVLPVTADADFNKTFFPESWTVTGANGYKMSGLTWDNSVLVFNDKTRIMPLLYIIKYIYKILKLENISDVNIDDQKNPYIVEIDEEEKKTINKFFADVDAGDHRIITRRRQKGGIINDIKVNSLIVDFKVDKYLAAAQQYENKILTFLGYNTVQIEKAERLITDEAQSNNERTRAQFTSAFDARKSALERVNELFGVNIEIEPNSLTSLIDASENSNINDTVEKTDGGE